jgi:catechol 2,3-dioxygenase
MAVLGALSLTLEVPDVEAGVRFYGDAGLVVALEGNSARFRCLGQERDSIVLLGGYPRKRLHHITLRADRLDEIATKTAAAGGKVVDAPPKGLEQDGLWLTDPHGMLIHLSETAESALAEAPRFEINAPGRIVRACRSAILPRSHYDPVRPRRLGHVVVFTPDVLKSVSFVTEALGMALADRSQDLVAFCCARKNSDHHVLAFAKSSSVGLHHASFQVNDPDEVGRGGRTLVEKSCRADWGVGRHTIGSNFFHYIQDPWGSWFEYFSDMDFIDDYARWSPTNYAMEDSLASWGPSLPEDFVRNYEAEPEERQGLVSLRK